MTVLLGLGSSLPAGLESSAVGAKDVSEGSEMEGVVSRLGFAGNRGCWMGVRFGTRAGPG